MHSVVVRVENVDAPCERARAHGARIVMEPTDFPYGERQYTAEDLAGHQWTILRDARRCRPRGLGRNAGRPILSPLLSLAFEAVGSTPR
jgi:Glyoxalase/Bleomycin resistance protein/Dioxygenase superfamily